MRLHPAGRYSEAQAAFEQYRAQTSDSAPHWILKALVLPTICLYAGQGSQNRNAKAARLAMARAENVGSEEERVVLLREALHADALHGLAWINLALLASRKESSRTAFWLFAVTATLQPWDVEAWALAVLMVLGRPDADISADEFGLVFTVGYGLHEGSMIREILRQVNGQIESKAAEKMANDLRDLASSLPARTRPKEIRIIDSEGKAHVLRFNVSSPLLKRLRLLRNASDVGIDRIDCEMIFVNAMKIIRYSSRGPFGTIHRLLVRIQRRP